MGKIDIEVDGHQVILDFSALSTAQLKCIKIAYGYQDEIDGESNPKTLERFMGEYFVADMSNRMGDQQKIEVVKDKKEDISEISDIMPDETP